MSDFHQLAQDQRSAVSDLSETIYTNGSETDPIGDFGKNNPYAADDAFTLGNVASEDFEPIGDYEHHVAGGYAHKGAAGHVAYNLNQFLEDDTLDNTLDDQRRGTSIFTMSTNETGFTGDEWGNQGSYHVQGLETGSDVVGPMGSDMDMNNAPPRRRGGGYRQNIMSLDNTADTSYIDEEDEESYRRGRGGYPDKRSYDIPQPVRQSPIVALYDAILSHPIITCMAFPCIPCLALYVKSVERHAPAAPRRRPSSKRNVRSKDSEDDESTFAEYHKNQKRFDDISRDESRSDINSSRDGKRNSRSRFKQGIRRVVSKNSEFSALNSKIGMRNRPLSRGTTAEFSQIQSKGRPSSSGMMSGAGRTEFSNIVSRPGSRQNMPQGGRYDPNVPYDNFGNHFSLTMDSGDQFIQNVPQGQWDGTSVDDTPKIRFSSSNRSVGWKLDNETQSRGTSDGGYYQPYGHMEPNQQFWGKVNDTFSTHTGHGQSHASSSFGVPNNAWNKTKDSISNKNQGYGQRTYGGRNMVSYDDSAYASGSRDNYYYGQ